MGEREEGGDARLDDAVLEQGEVESRLSERRRGRHEVEARPLADAIGVFRDSVDRLRLRARVHGDLEQVLREVDRAARLLHLDRGVPTQGDEALLGRVLGGARGAQHAVAGAAVPDGHRQDGLDVPERARRGPRVEGRRRQRALRGDRRQELLVDVRDAAARDLEPLAGRRDVGTHVDRVRLRAGPARSGLEAVHADVGADADLSREPEAEAERLARLSQRLVAREQRRPRRVGVLPCAGDVLARGAAEALARLGEVHALERVTQAVPIELRDALGGDHPENEVGEVRRGFARGPGPTGERLPPRRAPSRGRARPRWPTGAG